MNEPQAGFSQDAMLHQAELTSDAAVRYGDLYAIAQDLTFVIGCCERMLDLLKQPEDQRDGVTSQALWTAALIAYERVFAGGVRERLTQDHVRAVPNEGAEDVSDHYRSLRDRHIAHSVNPHEMSKVCAFVSPLSAATRGVVGIGVLHVKLSGFAEKDVQTLCALAAELRKQVIARGGELESALLDEAKTLGVAHLLAQPPAVFIVPGPEHVNTNRRRYRPDATPVRDVE
jgi:hypothetical protein